MLLHRATRNACELKQETMCERAQEEPDVRAGKAGDEREKRENRWGERRYVHQWHKQTTKLHLYRDQNMTILCTDGTFGKGTQKNTNSEHVRLAGC